MKYLKLLLIGTLVGALMALTVSSAFAAQGQITEVNPSGVGITKALGASKLRVAGGLGIAGVATIELDESDDSTIID